MKKIAIDKCEALLEKAKASVAVIEQSASLKQVGSAWSDLLVTSQRINTMLEQGAKGNSKSYAWWGLKRRERRTDTLLRYAHHARDADEHGLAEITERAEPYVALGVGPGAWEIDLKTGAPDGTPTVGQVKAMGGQEPGKSKFIETKPARVVLVRVFDRGDAYDPPTDGSETITPAKASRGLLDHLTGMIKEAKQLAE
jgi:hypothetical protein